MAVGVGGHGVAVAVGGGGTWVAVARGVGGGWLVGGGGSEFGRIVFKRDFDGIAPYLNPAQPITRQQIERAAEKANVPADEIDETVQLLSAHLGWDITQGAAG